MSEIQHINDVKRYRFFISSIIVVTLITVSLSFPQNALAQAIDPPLTENNDNTSSKKTPIDVVAVVKNGTQSIRNNLDSISQSLDNGNITDAMKQLDEAYGTVDVLNMCITTSSLP